MRVFIALDIDDSVRERISRFMEGVRGFAPDARWVRPESLHITLKFIGEQPPEKIEEIKRSLSSIPMQPLQIAFHGCGFFPTLKSARVFWIGIEAGAEMANLATRVDEAVSVLGIPKEERAYSPHLTLARGAGRSGAPGRRKDDGPNKNFNRLQEKLNAMPIPEFGTMTAREFFLFESQLLRGGARYTKIARFASS
jgi:RNA 2',3'-cyclic 3'-phosphodiesterase